MPGEGRYRFVTTRDQEGTYLMVYAPVGRPFAVNMKILPAQKIKAWWFNPRTGKSRMIGVLKNEGTKVFETPSPRRNDRLDIGIGRCAVQISDTEK